MRRVKAWRVGIVAAATVLSTASVAHAVDPEGTVLLASGSSGRPVETAAESLTDRGVLWQTRNAPPGDYQVVPLGGGSAADRFTLDSGSATSCDGASMVTAPGADPTNGAPAVQWHDVATGESGTGLLHGSYLGPTADGWMSFVFVASAPTGELRRAVTMVDARTGTETVLGTVTSATTTDDTLRSTSYVCDATGYAFVAESGQPFSDHGYAVVRGGFGGGEPVTLASGTVLGSGWPWSVLAVSGDTVLYTYETVTRGPRSSGGSPPPAGRRRSAARWVRASWPLRRRRPPRHTSCAATTPPARCGSTCGRRPAPPWPYPVCRPPGRLGSGPPATASSSASGPSASTTCTGAPSPRWARWRPCR